MLKPALREFMTEGGALNVLFAIFDFYVFDP